MNAGESYINKLNTIGIPDDFESIFLSAQKEKIPVVRQNTARFLYFITQLN